MKTVYNTSPNKAITIEHEGEVIQIAPLEMRNVVNEVAEIIKADWKSAQITPVSVSAQEPWELKVIGSLPPEMQNKVKFRKPTQLVPAAEPEVHEPPVPADEKNAATKTNVHICPRGCGAKFTSLVKARTHLKKCNPIPGTDEGEE